MEMNHHQMPDNHQFQLLKCAYLLIFYHFILLGFGLLVGQNKNLKLSLWGLGTYEGQFFLLLTFYMLNSTSVH